MQAQSGIDSNEKRKSKHGHCPNCTSELSKNPNHAQGIFECKSCGGRYLILETTKPKKIE